MFLTIAIKPLIELTFCKLDLYWQTRSLEITYIIFLCYRVMTEKYVITGNFNVNGYNKNCHSYGLG